MTTPEELEQLFRGGAPLETGQLVPLPSMPMLAPPPGPADPSVAQAVERGVVRQQATDEMDRVVPELDELRLGDEVEIPGGRVDVLTWIDPKRKRVAIGKGRHRTYASLTDVERINGRKVAAAINAKRQREAAEDGMPPPPDVELPSEIGIPEGLTLYPHQLDNISFITERGRGLIADEMGLGKTISAMVCIQAPAVVVCPALLKVNWAREINKWLPDLTVAAVGGKKTDDLDASQREADVVVINYDVLDSHVGWLTKRNNRTIIADEAHYLKNLDVRWNKAARRHEAGGNSPKRAKAFYELQGGIERMILLTGTPILNRVSELFPLLHMLDPKEWGSGYQFCMRYCAGRYEFLGRRRIFKCDGRSNMDELHERINRVYMIRHTKEAELKNLPPKSRGSVVVSLTKEYAKRYRKARNDFLSWLAESEGPEAAGRALRSEALNKLTRLRSICAAGKADAAVNWIVDHFESTGRPLVVMGVHRDAFDLIGAGLDKVNDEVNKALSKGKEPPISRPIRYGMVVGGQGAQRQKIIDAFQNEGTLDVVLYSIPIATGTTLTRASEVLFIERMWRPADQAQAEDRVHRIGQEQKVQITYLDAEGTIDLKMAQLLMDKAVTAAAIIDGANLTIEESAELVMGELTDWTGGSLFESLRDVVANPPMDETSVDIGPLGPVPSIFDSDGERFDDYEPVAEDALSSNPMDIYGRMVEEGSILDSWGDPV